MSLHKQVYLISSYGRGCREEVKKAIVQEMDKMKEFLDFNINNGEIIKWDPGESTHYPAITAYIKNNSLPEDQVYLHFWW